MKTSVQAGVAALICACALAFAATAAQATPGYVITQSSAGGNTRLILSPSALRLDFYAPVRSGGRSRAKHPKPLVGAIIRYSDARLILLDPVQHRYQVVALSTVMAGYDTELKILSMASPSLPPSPGTKPHKFGNPVKLPAAKLRRLKLTRRIAGVPARAYLLTQGALQQRLWYSAALPVPPARIRSLLAKTLSASKSDPLVRALQANSSRFPLQIDQRSGRGWRTVLRTLSIRHTVAGSLLVPPRGYRKASLLPTAGHSPTATKADVPATVIRCGWTIITLSLACANLLTELDPLVGPVSDHPAIWAFYWGSGWKNHLDYVAAINHGLENMVGDEFADPSSRDYWGPLSQYGVGQGKLLGYSIDSDNPVRSVGGSNVPYILGFLYKEIFETGAPTVWWRWFSNQSPIYAIFVDEKSVESSGWAGYHAFIPTEGLLFAGLAHPAIPFFIIKAGPEDAAGNPLGLDALSNDHESTAWQDAVDLATERASHEFVESATDPYPFFSWADPFKEPIWNYGEIADICNLGNISPYAQYVRVAPYGTAFSPYWSNDANACVPDTQPDVQVVYPQNNGTYFWDTEVTFAVKTNDNFDDGPEPVCNGSRCGTITWQDGKDGPVLSNAATFGDQTLSPGTHQIYVTVTDSQGGTRVVGPTTITVTARPPNVAIDEPSDGDSFAADHIINFRGVALDPSQGDLGPNATWSVDGTQVGTGAALFRYDLGAHFAQGSHTVTLSATNGAGKTSTATIHLTIGPPTGQPSVAILSPDSGSSFDAGTKITFTAEADPAGNATITGYSWSDDVDGALTGTTNQITTTLSGSDCQIVTHHVTVTATDNQGHMASDTITVNVGSIC